MAKCSLKRNSRHSAPTGRTWTMSEHGQDTTEMFCGELNQPCQCDGEVTWGPKLAKTNKAKGRLALLKSSDVRSNSCKAKWNAVWHDLPSADTSMSYSSKAQAESAGW